jgi:hypothetical protein
MDLRLATIGSLPLGGLTAKLDRDMASALLDQSVALFLGGQPEAARLILRDLVTATVGFEALAQLTNKSARSLRGMLSSNGRPGMDSLSTMFGAIRDWLKVRLEVRVVDAAR